MLLESYSKYNTELDFDKFQNDQPVIGILTTPVFADYASDSFTYNHFTWETNVHLIHYAGSWAVPVRYDLSDADLYELLDQINGVLFAGGATPFFKAGTDEFSPFYHTAKRIFEYSKRQKDQHGIEFPIFGICQGFEVIHQLANDDRRDTLSKNVIYNESRSMDLTPKGQDPKKTQVFKDFPPNLFDAMTREPLLYHAHDWVIATETYS